MYITVINIIYERGISFLNNFKTLRICGLQTKMAFKQRFKYLKNEKINLSLNSKTRNFTLSEYIIFFHLILIHYFFHISLYIRRAISTQTNAKKTLKKHAICMSSFPLNSTTFPQCFTPLET